MAANGNISHAEMWDDSALVDSWNDALEEYKKYHSIQARGEDVDEVLRLSEKADSMDDADTNILKEGQVDQPGIEDQHGTETVHEKTADYDATSGQRYAQSNTIRSAPAQASSGPPALPQHLIGQVHDEGLKNLLMSWYYAGYYTGLYEGQKQGQAGASAKHEV